MEHGTVDLGGMKVKFASAVMLLISIV